MIVGDQDWLARQAAGYNGQPFTLAGRLDHRFRRYLAERVWERVEQLYRWRLVYSPWKSSRGDMVRLSGGEVSELGLPDACYERMVVNRGLRRLRRADRAGYLAMCLRVKDLDYSEADFARAKKALAMGIIDFRALKPKVWLTTRT